ncbi:MAG: hypothetical protein R3322_15280, partial [Kiloniellales bacterium]|nr:hypothetical protein [Kiloniellales bacterium]
MTDHRVQEFRIGQSKVRHGLVVAGLGIVVGAATLLFADDSVADSQWIGGLLLAFGLAIGVHAWRTGRRAGAHMRVDADGVYFREWG